MQGGVASVVVTVLAELRCVLLAASKPHTLKVVPPHTVRAGALPRLCPRRSDSIFLWVCLFLLFLARFSHLRRQGEIQPQIFLLGETMGQV